MKEKELRLALVCYGGISLAVYMHGVTKDIWRLTRASRAFHDDTDCAGVTAVYRDMLQDIETHTGVRLRVLPDIIAGASAGGVNGIFLAHALETGQSLDPLTDLWLANADIDRLLDPDARPAARSSKFWAAPLVWMATRRPEGTVETTVSPETRAEVRHKLSRFIRSRWFEPPFGGEGFTGMLLDAFAAMARSPAGPPLLPTGHPLDLFVTVTDFEGYPESLSLHSPPAVMETEHRLILSFHARGIGERGWSSAVELGFAARATASFPGAFPPFTPREMDRVLERRRTPWSGRDAFLARILPRRATLGTVDDAALIDGSILANAPFAPALAALRARPSRREVDRRFVYIDPKPGGRSIRLTRAGDPDTQEDRSPPGFFRTILGSMSDIPREQPIRDNLEAIENRGRRIRRMRRITAALREEIEADVQAAIGGALFLDRPTPARLAGWRQKAQHRAAIAAGFAYPAYAHLKLSGVVEDIADLLFRLGGGEGPIVRESFRQTIWRLIRDREIDQIRENGKGVVREDIVTFFRSHDVAFRVRRLRFLARRLAETLEVESEADEAALTALHDAIYDGLAPYLACETLDHYGAPARSAAARTLDDPAAALQAIANARDLKSCDTFAETLLSDALWGLPKAERRQMLLAYLGFPFYDIATLPLLQGEALDEYDEVKVDRISPEDCHAIRPGGAAATLKGIEFNNFGAFFSRAYRENDYLWGRLHGAERLIDIVLSTVSGATLPDGMADRYRRAAFQAILDEEQQRLPLVAQLIAELREEIS